MPDRQTAFEEAIAETLTQVRAEIMSLVSDEDMGTITIHCGRKDLIVEVNRKRKAVPIVRNGGTAIK